MREAWRRRGLIPFSAETLLRQSLASKGKPKSAKHCLNISLGKLGKPRPDMQGANNPKWIDGRMSDPNHAIESLRLRRKLGKVHPEIWENIKRRYDYTCPACGRIEPDIVLTKDHIIPITCGGTNDPSNLQPLCKACNSRKHTMIKRYSPKKEATIAV